MALTRLPARSQVATLAQLRVPLAVRGTRGGAVVRRLFYRLTHMAWIRDQELMRRDGGMPGKPPLS